MAKSELLPGIVADLSSIKSSRAQFILEKVLTKEAAQFLGDLHRTFNSRRKELLKERELKQANWDKGLLPDFLSETKSVRESSWAVSPAPQDLQDRRVEITGPVERKMMINALNSGARVFMGDFEDSLSPTWSNILEGQINCQEAIRKTLEYHSPEGKSYRLNSEPAVLMVRPRGWHLLEKHFSVDGEPISASIFDFGLYFFHNAKELLSRKSGPYFYLPKMESHVEARLWNEVFLKAQQALNIPKGSIRATVLIETILAAFEMDEILFELREHITALNAGRWDYIFSAIKKFHKQSQAILPDRSQVTMAVPFMKSYATLLVKTCHKRGAHAMGGMAAFIPSRKDQELNQLALQKVKEDKDREAELGFDGTWIAHPDLKEVALNSFDQVLKGQPNQLKKMPKDLITSKDLLDFKIPQGKITEKGVRLNINVALQYLDRWLQGTGAAAIHNLMEDAATAEISRAQLWQWLHLRNDKAAKWESGGPLNPETFTEILDDEVSALASSSSPRIYEAAQLLVSLVLDEGFEEFLTLPAYEILEPANPNTKESLMQGSNNVLESLKLDWSTNPRWKNIKRPYKAEEVIKLRTSIPVEYSVATYGAKKLWQMIGSEPYVQALGAITGAQAVQMVRSGLKSIYLSGWQVAADGNLSGQTYPDQSLYPSNSVPNMVKRINNALMRADQIEKVEGQSGTDWYAPILADAEAGFGGPLHAFELMKGMVEAGASAVHFEDQLAAEKKCGHLGGKVLIPTSSFVRTLIAARLAADVLNVPTLIVARTDALGATLLTSDIDASDREFTTGQRTPEGYFMVKPGIGSAIARALAYAPYADLLWFETSTPDLDEAKEFARIIHQSYPGKYLAYNCSPSFNWKKHLDDATIAKFQSELGSMGYKYQFITLAGWHLINYESFELGRGYRKSGMTAYVNLQQKEFAEEKNGYTAVRHQREVGTGYFDQVLMTVTGGEASTAALAGSTEAEQFHKGETSSSRP